MYFLGAVGFVTAVLIAVIEQRLRCPNSSSGACDGGQVVGGRHGIGQGCKTAPVGF